MSSSMAMAGDHAHVSAGQEVARYGDIFQEEVPATPIPTAAPMVLGDWEAPVIFHDTDYFPAVTDLEVQDADNEDKYTAVDVCVWICTFPLVVFGIVILGMCCMLGGACARV